MSEAFAGSNGTAIDDSGVADYSGNPNAMDSLGFAFDDITVSTPAPGALSQALALLGQLFGAPPAAAAGIYSGATLIGFLNMVIGGPVTMMAMMQTHGLTINPTGRVTNSFGGTVGVIGRDFVGVSLNGVMVQINTVTGPVNLDSTVDLGTISDGTNTFPIGGYKAGTWAMINKLAGCPIARPLPVVMDASGINSANGVPLMDYANILAMFSKEIAFLAPNFIGGIDGIYDLRTAQRVVPPPNVGAAPLGFSVGAGATFAKKFLLMGGTAQGRMILLNAYTDPVNVLDPTTNAAPNIAGWYWLQVYNGSQQISFWPTSAPAYAYTGPAPTMAKPGYNAKDMVSPVVAVTNLLSNISTVIAPGTFMANNPSYNFGGPA